MPEDGATRDRDTIPTNLRLLYILEEVARAGSPVTPTALAEATGLHRTTTHRLLATAEQEGFLQRHVDGRSYAPGRRLRQLAGNTLSSQRIRTERLAIMEALAEEVGETCNLAAPGSHGMIYLDRVETHWPLRIQLPIGTQVPFHCTASGKMYLSALRADRLDRLLARLALDRQTPRTITDRRALRAELARTRARGYSTDDEEFMEGMAAVAVAVRDSEGRLLSTLSIHAPLQRHSIDSLVGQLPRLHEAAARLEELLTN
ncbi:MAG: IclR family transcriptional regulator [Alphaproteobacteria bacterium]|nr:MAG: IclR family transcriptional regulator [Alphaproteobacteria bacterium]